jgi:hypothetical protein
MGANRQQPMGTGGGMNAPQPSSMPSTVGATTTPSGPVNNPTTGPGGGTAGAAAGTLTSSSQGVIGLRGLSLTHETSGNARGSVITSDRENVKLDSGTQIILRTTGPPSQ